MNIMISKSSFGILLFSLICFAQYPIIQTKYTADPAPMVYNVTVSFYASHDEDDAGRLFKAK